MKKITIEAVRAFYNLENFKLSNTEIEVYGNTKAKFYLHNNKIAMYELGRLYISDAGWQTNTTKERLNGILKVYNMYVKQKNFQWFLCNECGECVEFKEGNSLNGVIIF